MSEAIQKKAKVEKPSLGTYVSEAVEKKTKSRKQPRNLCVRGYKKNKNKKARIPPLTDFGESSREDCERKKNSPVCQC